MLVSGTKEKTIAATPSRGNARQRPAAYHDRQTKPNKTLLRLARRRGPLLIIGTAILSFAYTHCHCTCKHSDKEAEALKRPFREMRPKRAHTSCPTLTASLIFC